ncbi:hypothetical protein GGI25_006266 [Coemansia spiralis]|uniref:gluconokinase n=2 Tax=Coemansia TaxID=4863 RepID=A0A9W8KUZ5_9FUNG|nr:P-loop containing nucleoside triphosphate hydrolase protein [Coemansia spiralis]KAJ1995630.1 hypothetical protein EDC05_000868 [Coemansia umbellata]KAJ2625039.1 hypothetical protein GGI26_000842 [Coemansia sp. RSA 1358]KAJ2669091.1 hypothetical protein GGI25_006266 [Coemansia spiralis]
MHVEGSDSVYPVRAIIVMGVGACGKSTIGSKLAHLLGDAPFIDADWLHPQQNIAKMSAGEPLGDSDRWPWLLRVRQEIGNEANKLLKARHRLLQTSPKAIGEHTGLESSPPYLYVVCGCSALKRKYREFLSQRDSDVPVDTQTHDTVFVYVDVSKQELERRLTHRTGHFFGAKLLDSQLEALEPPDNSCEAAIVVHGDNSLDEVVDDAYRKVRQYGTKNSL